MAANPRNIGGAPSVESDGSASSVISFFVPHRKVWLTPTAHVPCSNAASIGQPKTWTESEFCTWQWQNSFGGKSPTNVGLYIVYKPKTRPNIVQSLVTSVKRRRYSNEAKTRNPLKFAGVPQTSRQVSAVSWPKFTML